MKETTTFFVIVAVVAMLAVLIAILSSESKATQEREQVDLVTRTLEAYARDLGYDFVSAPANFWRGHRLHSYAQSDLLVAAPGLSERYQRDLASRLRSSGGEDVEWAEAELSNADASFGAMWAKFGSRDNPPYIDSVKMTALSKRYNYYLAGALLSSPLLRGQVKIMRVRQILDDKFMDDITNAAKQAHVFGNNAVLLKANIESFGQTEVGQIWTDFGNYFLTQMFGFQPHQFVYDWRRGAADIIFTADSGTPGAAGVWHSILKFWNERSTDQKTDLLSLGVADILGKTTVELSSAQNMTKWMTKETHAACELLATARDEFLAFSATPEGQTLFDVVAARATMDAGDSPPTSQAELDAAVKAWVDTQVQIWGAGLGPDGVTTRAESWTAAYGADAQATMQRGVYMRLQPTFDFNNVALTAHNKQQQ